MKRADKSKGVPSFSFINLGCPKNLVDAECVAGALILWGFEEAAVVSEADLVVVTTCAFIEAAVEESIDEILRAAGIKKESSVLAVLGCLVSREGSKLESLMPEVDLFLPVEEMLSLPERLLERGLFDGIGPDPADSGPALPRFFTPSHIAYVKIAEGCSNNCAYCLIPSIRGALVSRSGKEVREEMYGLARCGVKEAVVIAQDTGSWGKDILSGKDLFDLLDSISEDKAPPWVRLMYLHPRSIDLERLIGVIKDGKIIPYLDIPIQHASDRILSSMGRGYGRVYLEELFGVIKTELPDIVLRTTVMVGFPGETEEEFYELLDFLERYEIDHVGVFGYSPESGTRAFSYPGRVDYDIIEERKSRIIDIQMDIFGDHIVKRVGGEEMVLVDSLIEPMERPRDDVWGMGRIYGQAYEIDGVVFLKGRKSPVGEFVRARLEEAEYFDVFARSI